MIYDYTLLNKDFNIVAKMVAQIGEEQYQQAHKKVKDRYSSPKFYMNNFKRNRKRK